MENSKDKNINYYGTIKNIFSFAPLLRFWERESNKNKAVAATYEYIKERLETAPELLQPVTDFSLIETHRELIEELLSICISPAINKHEYYAAVFYDRLESFYETPAFKSLGFFENQMNSSCFNENCCLTPEGRAMTQYSKILTAFYGLKISYEYPIIYTTKDEKTGLERHYRIRILSWFCEIRSKNNIEKLSNLDTETLFENLDNTSILKDMVPPENFETEGFLIFNAIDITDQETISSLKFDLIGKESLTSPKIFDHLQHKLRVLLKKPHINLGLIAFPSGKKDMDSAIKMGSSILLQDSLIEKNIVQECKLYSDVIVECQYKLIYDIKDFGCSTNVEREFLDAGIRNLLIAPLIYKDEIIGILELASAIAGDLNKVNTLKLTDIFPLFAVCIESGLDDLNKSIQSVIKEKCTAIHPTVDWRFQSAALEFLNKQRNGIAEEMEEIVFENVQPFFGCSDIKDSSLHRNSAIKADLVQNLELVYKLLSGASAETPSPILEEMAFRVSNQLENLKKGLSSNNENSVINFIRVDVETILGFLKDLNPGFEKEIKEYREKINSKLMILSERRKDFEESLTLLNETISTELDYQQEKAQNIFPHYFEKYKTDGVEYNMYLGSSLVQDKKYSIMHLKGLRLWQLEAMCIIAKKCIDIRDELSIQLEATHLIFVQNAPMSIKFFYDEKKFDVSGSYDVRYEIIKKRIDKAEIKGSSERLVAPGKIAIVYSQETEAEEYRQYIEFLKTKSYVTGNPESLELEDMQGVQGLRALRVTVNKDLKLEKTG